MRPDSVTVPSTFIAYKPHSTGLVCALFYFEKGADVHGWWSGLRHSGCYSAYFKLEDFFTPGPTRFYATGGMDLHGGWRFLYSVRNSGLDKAQPIDDGAARELDRLQGSFAAEWLFFDDSRDAVEREAYEKLKLPIRHVNLRAHALDRLNRTGDEWEYRSHDLNHNVIDYLQRHWPLDYRDIWMPRPDRVRV